MDRDPADMDLGDDPADLDLADDPDPVAAGPVDDQEVVDLAADAADRATTAVERYADSVSIT